MTERSSWWARRSVRRSCSTNSLSRSQYGSPHRRTTQRSAATNLGSPRSAQVPKTVTPFLQQMLDLARTYQPSTWATAALANPRLEWLGSALPAAAQRRITAPRFLAMVPIPPYQEIAAGIRARHLETPLDHVIG